MIYLALTVGILVIIWGLDDLDKIESFLDKFCNAKEHIEKFEASKWCKRCDLVVLFFNRMESKGGLLGGLVSVGISTAILIEAMFAVLVLIIVLAFTVCVGTLWLIHVIMRDLVPVNNNNKKEVE